MGIDVIRQIDRLDEKVGGRFRLTSLIQKRIQEVVRRRHVGARLVDKIRHHRRDAKDTENTGIKGDLPKLHRENQETSHRRRLSHLVLSASSAPLR